MSKEIDPKWTPREVDKFLQKEYKLSLYHFVFSLDDIFSRKDYRTVKIKEPSRIETSWRDFWLDRIQELKTIKRYNLKSKKLLEKFLNKTERYLKSFFECFLQVWDSEENLVINDLSYSIESLIEYIKEFYLSSTEEKGRPPLIINILFLTWSHFIKSKKSVHVQTLLTLLNWFTSRFRKFGFEKVNFFDQKFKKELKRYEEGKSKLLPPIIEQYKKRFLIPLRHEWLERSINTLKKIYGPMKPLIIFSNGENLALKDCLENNPYYSKFSWNEDDMFLQNFDFKDFKYSELPLLLDEDEFEDDEPDIITQTLIFEETEGLSGTKKRN